MKDKLLMWVHRTVVSCVILVLTAYGVLLVYSLPRTLKVHVTGLESRTEVSLPGGGNSYISAVSLEGEKLLFRNDNTGWGFPPYFKFNAKQLAERAETLSLRKPRPVVLVRTFGVRLGDETTVPTLVAMKQVEPDYEEQPWFNWGVLVVHLVGGTVSALWWRSRRVRQQFEGELRDEWQQEPEEVDSVSRH